jgi:hypothetical protein
MEKKSVIKGTALPATGYEGPQGCQTSSLPRFLSNHLKVCGMVVSLMCQLPFTSRKIPVNLFCLLEAESTPGS